MQMLKTLFTVLIICTYLIFISSNTVHAGQGYSGNLTAADWTGLLQNKSATVNGILNEAEDQYKKWAAFTAGMDAEQIGVLLNILALEAADMQAAFNALNEMYGALNNQATTTSDRKTMLLKFQ